MPQVYADIAIAGVPRDVLSYAVPQGLRADLRPGQRALVPLGRRLVTGFVTRVHGETPDFSVKVLQEILDPDPVITPEVMKLCDWVHRYYICPLGDALKAALPQGMDVDSERYVSLRCSDEQQIANAVGKSRAKREIVNLLRTGEVISEAALKKRVGVQSISAQLRDLYVDGILQVESVLARPRARVKTINVVRLLPPWTTEEKIRELMEIMERRAPRQVNILALLWQEYRRGKKTVAMNELVKAAHGSSSQVRALEEKDIVEVLQEDVHREVTYRYEEAPKSFNLTPAQTAALAGVSAAVDTQAFAPLLLYGVTGSGKTQVYIDAIRHVLGKGKNALVLVPEISLTPQLVYRFRVAFGADVTVMHSRMSIGERYDAWRLTLEGKFRIVVGVRSAVFAPLSNIGLIVVDEEHESSYKQSDTVPRYNARDAVIMRASFERSAVLLGTATPSAESWHNASEGKYRLLELPERIDGAEMPVITPVNTAEARSQRLMHGSFSRTLIEGIDRRVKKREGCVVFQNRRGFSPHVECEDCGYVEECENCSISLTFHKDRNLLRCHYCGATRKPPVTCPRCGGSDIERVGAGTQRIEEELREALPSTRILRMDLDTTRRKGSHDLMISAFSEGEADVLLGTQMVARGLDFEHVTLVGIINAEQSLLLPDFRAPERTFQILTQVSGRSGRGKNRGEVILQARQPDHPVFKHVYEHDYRGFIAEELRNREKLFYPPFSRLVLFTFSGEKEPEVQAAAKLYYTSLSRESSFFSMHAPQPALIARINRRYRYHLMLRVDKNKDAGGAMVAAAAARAQEYFLRNARSRSVRVAVDVDALNMM